MSGADSSLRTVAGFLLACLLCTACQDGTGPGTQRLGHLAIVPRFESGAAALVPIEQLHLTLLRFDSVTVAADDTVDIAADQDSVDLSVEVTLLAQNEQFYLEMQLIDAAGDTVFRGGPTVVTASEQAGDVAEIVFTYTGVGFDAVDVMITTTGLTAFFGESVQLAADALDGNGDSIPGTPVQWSVIDPAAGAFPDPETGVFVAGSLRGAAQVVATLLTGPADTTFVIVQPPPSSLAIAGGNDQSGPVGGPLQQPLVVSVTGSDGLGVAGVEVAFDAAPGNGSLSATSVFTDAQGMAQVTWTLGLSPGAMQVTASLPAFSGVTPVTFVATAQAVPFHWTNPAGGNWSDPANWDMGAVPGPGSIAFIDLDGTYTVTVDVAASVDALTLGGATGTQTLALTGNPLTLATASTVRTNGVLDVSGGILGGGIGVLLSVSGTFKWTGGTVDGGLLLRVENGGSWTLGGGVKLLRGSSIVENHGVATWSAGNVDAGEGAAVINGVDGTFDLQGDVAFQQGPGATSAFLNDGAFSRTVGAGVAAFDTPFGNTGAVDLQAGALQLNTDGTSSGTIVVAANATLRYGGGSHGIGMITVAPGGFLDVTAGSVALISGSTLSGGVTVAAGATLGFSTGTHTLDSNSDISGAGTVEVGAGTVTVSGTYNVTGIPSTHITGGTVNFDNTVTPATMTALTLAGGTLGGLGEIVVSTAFDWTGGGMSGSGITTIGSGATASIGGITKNLDARQVVNNGTVTWTAGDIVSGNGAIITNAGTFDIAGDVALQHLLGGAIPTFDITAAGVLTRSTGILSVQLDANLNNNGILDLQSGTFGLTGAYTQATTATLRGSGTFDLFGDLITAGAVNMGLGTLVIGGVLNPTGVFSVGTIVFAGSGPQTIPALSYQNVEVTGDAAFPSFSSQTIGGDLVVSGTGRLDMGESIVDVAGAFRTQDTGILIMDTFYDELTVRGSILFAGGNTETGCPSGCLIDGIIRVQGDFTQSAATSTESFHAGGLHTVEFNGSVAQTILFESPGIGPSAFLSHFANLTISNTAAPITLGSDVFGHSNLNKFAGASPATVQGNGYHMAFGGLSVDGLVLDHVLFEYNGDPSFPSLGSFSVFDNVTFQSYNTADVQFTIFHPGGVSAFTLNNIAFTTPPNTGYYMDVTDSNTGDGNVLTIVMANPSPSIPGGLVRTDGVAVVTW